jgi:hypothetical protein
MMATVFPDSLTTIAEKDLENVTLDWLPRNNCLGYSYGKKTFLFLVALANSKKGYRSARQKVNKLDEDGLKELQFHLLWEIDNYRPQRYNRGKKLPEPSDSSFRVAFLQEDSWLASDHVAKERLQKMLLVVNQKLKEIRNQKQESK